MIKLSVVVPVYKTEQYLHRCVDSILNQSFRDFELILVDDGSPDACPEICEEYAKRDNRIKVVHKKNAGVAAARNTGLDVASGEYVTFVDSDDWIESNMYQRMVETAAEYDCDVVMCDCVKDFPDHSQVYSHDIRPGYYDYEQLKSEYYPHLLMMENVEYPATISNCLCMFRRIQRDNQPNLRYVEGVRFSEDLLFGAQMMYRARSFYYMKGETFYHYCMNPTSATHTFTPDKWKDYSRLHQAAEQYFLAISEYDFRHQLDLMLLFFMYNALGDIHGAATLSKREKRKQIRSILRCPEIRKMFSRIRIWKLPIFWKLKILTVLYKCGFTLVR